MKLSVKNQTETGEIMDELWDKWEKHYGEEDTKDICKDGIVFDNTSEYHAQKIRILFIGKECNNYPGGDIRALSRYGVRRSYFKNVARWTTGIYEGFPPFEEIDNYSSQYTYLQKVALINLKKTTGGSKADMSQISSYAKNDTTLLQEQVELINPNVIITLGTHDIALWLLDLAPSPKEPNSKPYFSEKNNSWIIPYVHPSFRGYKKLRYDNLKEIIFSSNDFTQFLAKNR